jgi:hypothetical protein
MAHFSRQRNKGPTEAFMQRVRHFCPILTKFGFTRHVIRKHPIDSFTQISPVGEAPINWDRQTNMLQLRGSSPDYANFPTTALDLYMGRYGQIKLVRISVLPVTIYEFSAVNVAMFSLTKESRCTV